MCAAGFAVPLGFSSVAAADECGPLKVPGYTAERMTGLMKMQAFVSPEKERTVELGGAGTVQITEIRTGKSIFLNPKTKRAVNVPPPAKPPGPTDGDDTETNDRFVDREPGKDGLVTIIMGIKTPKGKEWMIRTSCRPDGIWIEKKIKTPKGLITIKQSDIKLGPIPATEFEVPGDYKIIQAPPRPTGKN